MIQPQLEELAADLLPGEAVVALYYSDVKPLDGPAALLDWRMNGKLTRMLLDGNVSGRAGEHVMLQSNGKLTAKFVLFVGGGKWHGLCSDTHGSLVRHMVSVASKAGFKNISLAFQAHEDVSTEVLQQQVAEALKVEGVGIESCSLACYSVDSQ